MPVCTSLSKFQIKTLQQSKKIDFVCLVSPTSILEQTKGYEIRVILSQKTKSASGNKNPLRLFRSRREKSRDVDGDDCQKAMDLYGNECFSGIIKSAASLILLVVLLKSSGRKNSKSLQKMRNKNVDRKTVALAKKILTIKSE